MSQAPFPLCLRVMQRLHDSAFRPHAAVHIRQPRVIRFHGIPVDALRAVLKRSFIRIRHKLVRQIDLVALFQLHQREMFAVFQPFNGAAHMFANRFLAVRRGHAQRLLAAQEEDRQRQEREEKQQERKTKDGPRR